MFKDGNGILTNDRTTPPNRQYRRLSAHHTTWDSEPALGQLSGLFIHNHPFKCDAQRRRWVLAPMALDELSSGASNATWAEARLPYEQGAPAGGYESYASTHVHTISNCEQLLWKAKEGASPVSSR